MKVYMVMFDWATEDDSAVEVELFDTYKKAYDRFKEIISNEMVFDISWVAEAFDENGIISEDYDFEEHIESDGSQEYDCWWNITDKNDWYRHDYLDLQVVEVK
jgi:hypothetical protein